LYTVQLENILDHYHRSQMILMWVLVNDAVQDQLSHVHHYADIQGRSNFR